MTQNGKSHQFDSFECAIHELAPTCEHCGTRILGHGVENGDHMAIPGNERGDYGCVRFAGGA